MRLMELEAIRESAEPVRCVVGNPGARPGLVHAATGLAHGGCLERYVTDIALGEASAMIRLAHWMPGRLGRSLETGTALRGLPVGIDPRRVARTAGALGWADLAARRGLLPSITHDHLQSIGRKAFDRGFARSLRPTDDLAIVSYGTAETSLKRSAELGIRSLLYFPVAHHGYARRLLEEEARLQPEYAGSLQFPSTTRRLDLTFDRELSRADSIWGLSSFHVSTFAAMGVDPSKFLTIPLGVDAHLFSPERLERGVDGSHGCFRVLFVGQVTQRKGLSYLIDGFRKAAIPNSELLLVGGIVGTNPPWRGLAQVRHLPPQARFHLPAIYASADVFVMPSLIEGFCLTAMEAMCSGLPIIVTPHTFGDDVVRDGMEGWTVPIRDSDQIADHLRQLHADRESAFRMGQNARRRAEQYSWARLERTLVAAVCRDGSTNPCLT